MPRMPLAFTTQAHFLQQFKSLGRQHLRDGQPRKDNTLRAFRDTDRAYLSRWDLLGLTIP